MPSVTGVTNPEKCHTLSDHAKNLLAVLTLASSAWAECAWVVPKVRRVAILSNPAGPAQPATIRNIQEGARSLGLQLALVEARGPGEFDAAFATIARERAGAVFVVMDPAFIGQRGRLPELAAKNRLRRCSLRGSMRRPGA